MLFTLQRFQVLRQKAGSVLADAVHVSSMTHACEADAEPDIEPESSAM